MHEQARDPALALPGELALAGPVAAQPDLDVPFPRHLARLDKPPHDRPVRDPGDAEDLGARVGVRVEVHQADRPMLRGARGDVGLADRVVPAEHDRDRPGREHLPDRRLDRRV